MTKALLRAPAVAAALLLVASCGAADPKFSFTYAEKRGVLESNGLKFVVVPDKSTELVEVDVRYNVGSKEDPPGKAGLAHLVEHMMFQLKPDGEGTPPLMHFVNQLSTFFNAYTNWDSTHYMTTSRAEQLEALLKIEAMRLYFGCQTITEDEFLREREVVRNEIRQRTGTAEGQVPQLVLSAVYPEDHAYARMIGGDDQQLTSISLQDACDFIGKYYVPERATVIVAGGVDYDDTVALITKWFGKLERKTPGQLKQVEPLQIKPGRVTYDLDVERHSVNIVWALPPQNTPEGQNAMYGINQAFFRTASKADEYDFAYSVSPAILGGPEAPIFLMSIELKGMDRLDEALEFVWKGARAAHRGFEDVTWQQFDAQKKIAQADFIAGLEPLVSRTNQIGEAVQFSRDVTFDSTEEYLIHELKRYESFDGGAIASIVKKTLDPDKAKVIVIKANKEGIKGDKRVAVSFQTKSHDKAQEPEVDPKEARRPLTVKAELKALDNAIRYELGNGMKVVLLPVEGAMPLVAADLIFDVGDVHSSTPGLADAAARFLRLPLDAEAMQMTGVGVSGGTNNDHTIFSSSAVNIYLDIVINALERTITAGEYYQESIEGWQKRTREYYKLHAAQEELEFQRQILAGVFGGDHPYTKNGIVLPDAIGGIGKDGLNAFRRKHYTAGNATLVIAGNFDPEKAKRYISSAFGGWGKGHVDAPMKDAAQAAAGAQFVGVVAEKEGPQMTVAIAYPAPAGIDGEEAARMVLTEMLNSRMGDIRFKLGSTYGVYARRTRNVGPSSYEMGGTVDAPRAGESLKAMREGIDMLRQGGEQWDIDFVRARRSLIQQLLGESTVSRELAGRLGTIARFDLTADYYDKLLKTIAAVPVAQVKALIARELDPAREVVVTLADRATVERAFAEAGITNVKIVEPTYK